MAPGITPDERVAALFLDLPIPPTTHAPVVHVREAGRLCWVGPAYPFSEGRLVHAGRLGLEIRLDQGQQAARIALVQALGMLHNEFGTLNKVQSVALHGFIAAGPDFRDHAKVCDQASQLLHDLFGTAGQHTRTAVGVASLAGGACVALELVCQVT